VPLRCSIASAFRGRADVAEEQATTPTLASYGSAVPTWSLIGVWHRARSRAASRPGASRLRSSRSGGTATTAASAGLAIATARAARCSARARRSPVLTSRVAQKAGLWARPSDESAAGPKMGQPTPVWPRNLCLGRALAMPLDDFPARILSQQFLHAQTCSTFANRQCASMLHSESSAPVHHNRERLGAAHQDVEPATVEREGGVARAISPARGHPFGTRAGRM
jgi:hypothetical protein